VPPERVVDYLALVGDTSDNIPGVKGIGDKTAVQLLEAYGDLDAILARAADIPGKRPREALLSQADNARLSRQLVTLQRNVPVELDLEQLRVRAPDAVRLTALFNELEFRTLIPKLVDLETVGTVGTTGSTASPAAAVRPPESADPHIVAAAAELPAMLEDLRRARRRNPRWRRLRFDDREFRARPRQSIACARRLGARAARPQPLGIAASRGQGHIRRAAGRRGRARVGGAGGDGVAAGRSVPARY